MMRYNADHQFLLRDFNWDVKKEEVTDFPTQDGGHQIPFLDFSFFPVAEDDDDDFFRFGDTDMVADLSQKDKPTQKFSSEKDEGSSCISDQSIQLTILSDKSDTTLPRPTSIECNLSLLLSQSVVSSDSHGKNNIELKPFQEEKNTA